MRTYKYKGKEVIVKIIKTITPNRIQLHDASDMTPYATATSNIPALENLEGYVAVKDYSENQGMLEFLIMNEIVEPPITFVQENFVSFPICKLK